MGFVYLCIRYAVHHQQAADQKPHCPELQTAKLDSNRHIHLQTQRNIPRLSLQCCHQNASLIAPIPHAHFSSFLVVNPNLIVWVIGSDPHLELGVKAQIRIQLKITYPQLVDGVLWNLWVEHKVENHGRYANDDKKNEQKAECSA
ncbi:hypothetical protein Nepgr_005754 [Nepenthes gracilis]|uniref:Uncharacterized protein n=1 Tax=Nepenthes gracilis TaxID=150966 RepID=A0AAD3XGR4_NEPGR|nr:hypothetical protein Nepgr_005754 [Nepenthes gracilis]